MKLRFHVYAKRPITDCPGTYEQELIGKFETQEQADAFRAYNSLRGIRTITYRYL